MGELAVAGMAVALARSARQMTSKVTIYTNGAGELFEVISKALAGSESIKADNRLIEGLALGSGGESVEVSFGDGSKVSEAFLVHMPRAEVVGPFARQLALELTENGDIKTQLPFQQTSVKGVYAGGDCASRAKAVIPAMSTGTFAGIGIAHDLQGQAGYRI